MVDGVFEMAAGAVGGTALTTILAKAFISRSLKDLEEAVGEINKIKTELATITFRLEDLSKTHQLLRELDRKVIALETKLNGRSNYHHNKR